MIDYKSFQPDLKALRRILYALATAAVVTFGITLFLILHPAPQPTIAHGARKCACKGEGIFCPRPSPLVKTGYRGCP